MDRLVALGILALLTGVANAQPADLAVGAAPLDRYSFPSGHTLHAVAFSTVVLATYGILAWLLVPFTLAVATSRVVLGLHYPTDVAAGAAVGALLAVSTLALF